MKIRTGYLYHIKDEYFDIVNDDSLMQNHERGKKRPTYFTIKDKDILWFIPISSKVEKYKRIIDKKIVHTKDGIPLKIPTDLQDEIKSLFKNMLGLKKRGTNLFFTDIDKLKEKMLEEIR